MAYALADARSRSWKRRLFKRILLHAGAGFKEYLENYLGSFHDTRRIRNADHMENGDHTGIDDFSSDTRPQETRYLQTGTEGRLTRPSYAWQSQECITDSMQSEQFERQNQFLPHLEWNAVLNNLLDDPSLQDSGILEIVRNMSTDRQLVTEFDSEFEDPGLFSDFAEVQEVVQVHSSTTSGNTDEGAASKHLWPCVVCLEKPPETIFAPCSHAVCCPDCSGQVSHCPVCTSGVDHVDRVYFTQNTCVVCMDNPPETVFKPCCHAVCCGDCTATLLGRDEDDTECPICKACIRETDMFLLAYT